MSVRERADNRRLAELEKQATGTPARSSHAFVNREQQPTGVNRTREHGGKIPPEPKSAVEQAADYHFSIYKKREAEEQARKQREAEDRENRKRAEVR